MKTFLLSIIVLAPFILKAQPGTLDKSFGDSGIVFDKSITGGGLNKIALQSDGKIIGGGRGDLKDIQPFKLIRYNTNGSIDDSFGDNGVTGGNEISQVFGMAITKGDGIVVFDGNGGNVKLAKYKKDGGLDSSFGINGLVILHIGSGGDATSDIVIQPDNKIVVCGYIINEPNEARQGFLIRYMPDGSLDNSFGNNGIVIWGAPDDHNPLYTVNALTLQQNGQIIVPFANISSSFARAYRFNSDGSMDKNFGNNGEAKFQSSDNFVSSYAVFSLAIQPDGKIIGGGNAGKKNTGDLYMAAARLNTDGSIDSSFGNNGIQHVLFGKGDSQATAILLQKDGKIILSGWANAPDYSYGYFALTRLKPDGSFDESFGDNGQTTTETEGFAAATSAVLQQDEKIVLGGSTVIGVIGGSSYFLLARYNNDEVKNKKQIIITKIKRWLQHRNGIVWNGNNSISNYVVQRSYDGINFNSITRINTGNNSNYSYADSSPLSGNNYYRLQTTSVSGSVNYSNVIAVTADEDAIKISPNPAKNNLQVQGLSSNQKIKLTIVDFTGNIVISQQLSANSFTSYNLNIAALKPGNYILKIEMNNTIVTKKFVKE